MKRQKRTLDSLVKPEIKQKEGLLRRRRKEKVEKMIDFDLNERIDQDKFFWKRKKKKRA